MKICKRIVCIVACLIGLFVLVVNISHLFSTFSGFLAIIVVCAVCWWLYCTKVEVKVLYIGIIAVAFVIRLLFVVLIDTEPVSDFEVIFRAAQGLAMGDRSMFGEGQYLHTFGYYIPFALYETLFIKLFGGGALIALKFMNVLFATGTVILVLLLTKALAGEKAACVSGFLYAIFPAPVMLMSVLTSQHQEVFFFLLSIWFLVVYRKRKKYLSCILAGISMLLAQLFRPEAILLIASLLFCSLFWIWKEPVRENWGRLAKGLGIVFGVYIVLYFVVSFGIKTSGLNDGGLVNRVPESKFLIGTNVETLGMYTDVYSYLGEIPDKEERHEAFKRDLKENLAQGGVSFFSEKMRYYWSSYEDPYWAMGQLLDSESYCFPDFVYFLLDLERCIFCLIWMLFTYHMFFVIKNEKDISTDILFFATLVCANIAVYFVTEIQPRYRYLIMPIVIVLCLGSRCMEKGRSTYKERRKR